MTPQYFITKAKNEHVHQVIELIFNIWINEYSFKVFSEDYPDLQNIEEYYHNKEGGNFLIAIVDKDIVGTIACDRLNNKIYVLKRMFVKTTFRRQGIAQSLMNKLLEGFLPGTSFFLSTKEDLAFTAKRFYSRNGFEIISKESLPDVFPFFYEDDLFMRKII